MKKKIAMIVIGCALVLGGCGSQGVEKKDVATDEMIQGLENSIEESERIKTVDEVIAEQKEEESSDAEATPTPAETVEETAEETQSTVSVTEDTKEETQSSTAVEPTPEPVKLVHTHSYNASVTANATCEGNGVRTYTCVDGDDSYTESIPALGHDWVAVTQVINHDATGHFESQTVQTGTTTRHEYECQVCGARFDNASALGDHRLAQTDINHFGSGSWIYDYEEPVYSTQDVWVVDSPAWSETVTVGYQCSRCGATK